VKEYFPHDFRKLALETLDKVAETEPERIAINRQGDKLIDITVYERAPGERRCYSRRKTRVFYIQWSGFAMESIQISPPYDCHIPCLTEDGTPREIKEIVEDVKKVDKYKIGVTVRILKKLSRSEVVASLPRQSFSRGDAAPHLRAKGRLLLLPGERRHFSNSAHGILLRAG